jgi:hypothetical protein
MYILIVSLIYVFWHNRVDTTGLTHGKTLIIVLIFAFIGNETNKACEDDILVWQWLCNAKESLWTDWERAYHCYVALMAGKWLYMGSMLRYRFLAYQG